MNAFVAACAALCAAVTPPGGGAPPRSPSAMMFAQKFSVVTGTTIPLNHGWDSVTQSGVVHYDGERQYLRMDHKGAGRDVTLIARFSEGRLYLLSEGKCANVSVDGTLLPFATPKGSVLNQDRMIVRDTYVVNYNGVMRGNDGKLHELDFYVKKVNRTAGDVGNWIPWRISYAKARRREIGYKKPTGPAAEEEEDDDRDWRFYDELHADDDGEAKELSTNAEKPANPLEILDPVSRITTDYYNFQSGEPPEALFQTPEECAGTTPRYDVKFSFSDSTEYGHQIFELQRTLSELADTEGTTYNLLEDACIRYFCDASEREKNHDPQPIFPEDVEGK